MDYNEEPYQELSKIFFEEESRVAYNFLHGKNLLFGDSMTNFRNIFIVLLISVFVLASCSLFTPVSVVKDPNKTDTVSNTASPITFGSASTATPTPFQPETGGKPFELYLSPSAINIWSQQLENLTISNSSTNAGLTLSLDDPAMDKEVFASFTRVYAVGAPFPTVTDGVVLSDLQAVWNGQPSANSSFTRLFMTEATKAAFTEFWGSPAGETIQVVAEPNLVRELWKATDAWGIIPFEEIDPRLKIIKVDGDSPLDRPMDADQYPLTLKFHLSGNPNAAQVYENEIAKIIASLPETNRDETKMTVVVMSGTTALARVTLKKIELNGYEYPVELVKDWFLSADLRHVSNEVSFLDDCQYTDAFTMQFCSKPDQIKVLENLGINVVESTGNHLNDYDEGLSFSKTLQMYADRGWLNFGGGINSEIAKMPVTTEINGNKVAFIGCNPVGFDQAWATDTRAGAANCDYDYYYQTIGELKKQGYVVIATFQETEVDLPMYEGKYQRPFKEAAKAGADIVQGSQAHVPMGFEFVGKSYIHYGLGNFLFDQMEPQNIREFIDRHVIYNGNYIGTEVLTTKLMDWSRPVPMDQTDRALFLEELFNASKMRLE